MTTTESQVVNSSTPKLHKRLVDNIINRRNKDQPNELFEKLKNDHPEINYTIEVQQEHLLDARIIITMNPISKIIIKHKF